jgi:hypothetical protein
MRKVIQLSAWMVMVLLNISSMQAGTIDLGTKTILKLGGQMSNVRLMLETYALIGIGIPYSEPDKLLKSSIKEYEDLLAELEKRFEDPVIRQGVHKSKTAWKPVKKALLTASANADKEAMKKHAQFIHDNIRSVIKELASAKQYLLKKRQLKNSDMLNASIEIGASARRLSAHYMMRLWKLDDPTIEQHWKRGLEIYGESVERLKHSSFYQDAAFKKLLDRCSHELRYFTMLSSLKTRHVPTLVHKKAEGVYRQANEMSRIILSSMAH